MICSKEKERLVVMKSILYFTSVITFVMCGSAFAYLNPSSGTGLIAFLVAIAAGLIFYSKKIFYGIKSLFKKDKNTEEK